MAHSGSTGGEGELVELDPNGKVLGRMRFDKPLYHLYAFTSTAVFYAGRGAPGAALLRLDPVTGARQEVESLGKPWTMFGADGPNLVYRTLTADGHLKIGWFPPAVD